MREPPAGTVTFLFTDIEGSTRLWEQDASAMRLALARHDQIVRDAIEASGGYVFKTIGDAFCAAFVTAHDALTGALTAQLTLAGAPWEIDPPLRARMALHTGAAEERGGDYFGPPVNRVARLLAAGHGGQTLISLVTQELIRDSLPPSGSLLDLGNASLKDLTRPERVYQLQHPSLPVSFPPLRALDNPDLPNNLPQQATTFIGREKETAEVKALLTKTRLLTLVGAGGAGKTRLALQAAADLLDGEGDGVWLVELAPLADAELVPQTVAQALSIKESGGQPIAVSLVDALKSKSLLLVLDNCEHLVAACAKLVSEVLRSCPTIHILATSREPLGVAGEQVYRIPSLSMPANSGKSAQTAESLSQYEAVRLFIERARAVQPSFSVTDKNAPALAQICYQLDGIPLAIELAAARVRSLSVEDVNARLSSRFRLLTGGSRDTLPRQQTLRALIDWSYDLLTDQERTMLRLLSTFAGGWTLELAESVCTGDEIGEWEVLDLLTSLSDKSLVVYEEAAEPYSSAARYRMSETVRQYGQARLEEGGETSLAKQRHMACFQNLAEMAEPKLTGPDMGNWLSRLEADHDNLRAALLWCEQNPDGAEAGLRLTVALWRFWYVRGHLFEGRQWLSRALQHAGGLASPEILKARADALNGAGNLANAQSDSAALALYRQSLDIKLQIGDQRGIANSLANMGNVTKGSGDYAQALAFYQDSLEIMRKIDDKPGIGLLLNNLGGLYCDQGNHEAARPLLEEGLEYMRRAGDVRGIAIALLNLGSTSRAQGDFGRAVDQFQESLEMFRQIRDQSGIGFALNFLGDVAIRRRDYPAAQSYYGEGLEIRCQIGDQLGVIECLEGFAELAYLQGMNERGLRLWGATAALREQIGLPLPPQDQQEQDKAIVVARQSAGGDAFDSGRAMSMDQAVKYALLEPVIP